ncbi:MAG: hypothetical protein GF370_03870 [Candidatus Nealsonbacteria bacterium]|nr:hypothetical protein [Candidatus Nealsonbacteria bacterium]
MTERAKSLLKLVEKIEGPIKNFRKKYKKRGVCAGLEDSYRCNGWNYLIYLISKITPLRVKCKTFWGETMCTFLPKQKGTFFFGCLGSPQEIRLIKFLIKNIQEKSIFYDVGANCGFYSLLVSALTEKGEV